MPSRPIDRKPNRNNMHMKPVNKPAMKPVERQVRSYDVAIIGGGASGMAAAIELGMTASNLSVAILEKNDTLGKKIRATGSGRCNITNTAAEGYVEIMEFFKRIGLMTKSLENGLVYPYSESAADVTELLTMRVKELGTEVITDAEVTDVINNDNYFCVKYSLNNRKTEILAKSVVLALGGKAGPTYGTTGDGYKLARNLGHSIVTPVPILTSVECSEWDQSDRNSAIKLAGTRTRGIAKLYKKDDAAAKDSLIENHTEVFAEPGEIQFTKYGVSGICVFNMTRHMRYDRTAGESLNDFTISLDLFPDGNIEEFLKARREHSFEGEMSETVLKTVLKENIADYVLKVARAEGIELSNLSDRNIKSISKAVHNLNFHPAGIRGWKEAQATSGGVDMSEINPEASESKLVPGLFITGELADRDFKCGGYNLSNAWITGMQAAHAIAERVGK